VLGEGGLPDPLLIRPLVFDPGLRDYYELGAYQGKAFSVGRKR
jgi:hypothetical protein